MRKLYPVSVSCGVLEVSASGYFNWLRRRESDQGRRVRGYSDEALLAHIRAIHAHVKGEYGWPRMYKELLARGICSGKDQVRQAHATARHQGQDETQVCDGHRQQEQPTGGARSGAAALQA